MFIFFCFWEFWNLGWRLEQCKTTTSDQSLLRKSYQAVVHLHFQQTRSNIYFHFGVLSVGIPSDEPFLTSVIKDCILFIRACLLGGL